MLDFQLTSQAQWYNAYNAGRLKRWVGRKIPWRETAGKPTQNFAVRKFMDRERTSGRYTEARRRAWVFTVVQTFSKHWLLPSAWDLPDSNSCPCIGKILNHWTTLGKSQQGF